MGNLRTFLETSTIHGLAYISTSRKYVKSFWILIVMGGFIGAGVLINQSFENWNESPVKTTIETLPITNLKFPKVTVCPPKNTYTNLNYDLMMVQNMTFARDSTHDFNTLSGGALRLPFLDSERRSESIFGIQSAPPLSSYIWC